MLADNVSGRIRSEFFASVSNKDMSFYDRVQVGEIRKFNCVKLTMFSGKTKLRHLSYKRRYEQQF